MFTLTLIFSPFSVSKSNAFKLNSSVIFSSLHIHFWTNLDACLFARDSFLSNKISIDI